MWPARYYFDKKVQYKNQSTIYNKCSKFMIIIIGDVLIIELNNNQSSAPLRLGCYTISKVGNLSSVNYLSDYLTFCRERDSSASMTRSPVEMHRTSRSPRRHRRSAYVNNYNFELDSYLLRKNKRSILEIYINIS